MVKIFWLETKYEFLKNLRLPIYSLSTLLFPVMFYIFFGLSFGQGSIGPVSAALYYAVTYGAFGIIGAALFGFGVTVAVERGQGWMRLKRACPMPPLAYFVAKIIMSLLFGAMIILTLLLLGALFGGLQITIPKGALLVTVLMAGALPFCAIGLAIGYLVGPNSAPAIVNLVYLPMAFAAGLWIPIQALPRFIQGLAPLLPTYHFAQLALGVIGASQGGSAWLHLGVLAAYATVFLLLALFLYFRDEGKTYG